MMYKRLDDTAYTKLRKQLLEKKGSRLQRELLESIRLDDRFLEFVRDKVGEEGTTEVLVLDKILTEHEYKEPPKDTERGMYEAWKDISPETACRVTFWGAVTLLHIENKRIRPSYLAANGGSLSDGLERVDKALSASGSEKDIDSCVRTILRRMSGLPEPRGNSSVYVNCPFGRAWWRGKLTEEVCEKTGASRDSILDLLRWTQDYWETLVRLLVSRNSVLGDSDVRVALIWTLAELLESTKESEILKSKNLRVLCRLLGVRCAWQELGMLDLNEVKALIGKEISSIPA